MYNRPSGNEYGARSSTGWKRPGKGGLFWSWKALEYSLVVGAFLIAFAVWFIPNWTESPEMKALEAAVNERKAARLAYEARQAEAKREAEELGLVYLPVPPELHDEAKKKGVALNPDGTPKAP